MSQTVIAWAIVGLAVAYLGWKTWRRWSRTGRCGCEHCPVHDRAPPR